MVYAPDLIPEDPEAALSRRIEAIERQLAALGGADVLRTAGIRVAPGKLIILGDLEVPNGAIKNDYLESPIGVDTFTASASNFAVPHAATNLTTATLTVPAERTTAVVVASAVAVLAVRDAGADSLFFRIRVGAADGPATFRVYAAYDQFGESVGFATTVTGLTPGGSLTVSARTATGTNDWPTWAANTARVDGAVLWLR